MGIPGFRGVVWFGARVRKFVDSCQQMVRTLYALLLVVAFQKRQIHGRGFVGDDPDAPEKTRQRPVFIDERHFSAPDLSSGR